jgi:hypothetical protein
MDKGMEVEIDKSLVLDNTEKAEFKPANLVKSLKPITPSIYRSISISS